MGCCLETIRRRHVGDYHRLHLVLCSAQVVAERNCEEDVRQSAQRDGRSHLSNYFGELHSSFFGLEEFP